jgi:hypothetical protein
MSSPQHKRRPAEATAAESASPPGRGALVGYARVSTDEQNLALQLDALVAVNRGRFEPDANRGSFVSPARAQRSGFSFLLLSVCGAWLDR